MLRNIIRKVNKVITSVSGDGLLLFMILIIPLVFFVPAIALDLSAYQATKTQMQNALEVASASALNQSIVDDYRADKILKLKSTDYYGEKLRENIKDNFNTKTNPITLTTISPNKRQIDFTPGYDFTPNNATLIVDYGTTKEDEGAAGTIGNTGIKITLTLTTNLKLPIASKILALFGITNGSGYSPKLTVTNNVTGVRVLKPTDFGSSNYNWQTEVNK